jgi:two-component system sensor histidine kinase/response regulator
VKCLLVDDLEENLLALSALLQRQGASHATPGQCRGDCPGPALSGQMPAQEAVEILTARSGREALELLLVHDVALALLDVQMPEMDGFELAELMRGSERTRQIPIIFITAGTHEQHRVFQGYESGAVDFLFKPIEPHILQSKAEVFFQLYRQKQQLASELRDKTETLRLNEILTAALSHDLRSPLNAVLTSALLIQRRSTEPPVQEIAGRIISSGRRMSRMIEDVLDMARARLAGGIPLKREAADLGALVDRVVGEVQAAYPDRRIEVKQAGNLSGHWDGERLAQVASNLLGNAVQHGEEGTIVRVTVDGRPPGEVILKVANTGTIPPDLLPHLFDPFRGAPRQPGRSEGLGLGLYIVQQIVVAHGGTVDVQSGEDNKTVFSVRVPR